MVLIAGWHITKPVEGSTTLWERIMMMPSTYLLLSIDDPYLKYLLYTSQTLFYPDFHSIYPDTLLLSCAHSGASVPYMDIEIWPEGRGKRLTIVLYDKRRPEPQKSLFLIKYPYITTNISQPAKYNIVTSQ